MPRTSRLIISDQKAVYHVMSRTALDGLPLKDVEKDCMLDLIKRYSALYFTEILGFCLMGNHFHLLVKMIPENRYADEQIQQRFETFYGDSREFAEGQIPYWREKLSSLSEFMREIKVGFARYYNRRHNRRGYFWGDRFKSVIVDKSETLINCLAYIDLNPMRAGSVDSGTAPAILRIPVSSDQRSLWPKITSGLNTYFTLSTKKSPNRSKAWKG